MASHPSCQETTHATPDNAYRQRKLSTSKAFTAATAIEAEALAPFLAESPILEGFSAQVECRATGRLGRTKIGFLARYGIGKPFRAIRTRARVGG